MWNVKRCFEALNEKSENVQASRWQKHELSAFRKFFLLPKASLVSLLIQHLNVFTDFNVLAHTEN